MVKSSVFSVEIPGVTLEEILGFFQRPEHFVDYHREANGNDHVRVGRWKPSPASVAAVEASAAALAEAAAEAGKGGSGSKKSSSSSSKAAAAAPAAAPTASAEAAESYSHPACEPLSRHVAFLVSFRAPAWFKKAVGTETVKVRDCHDLVARVDRSEGEEESTSPSTTTSSEMPKLETIIMRSQPRLWLPTAGTELKIAEITFDVAVKPDDDEEETDDEGEFSRGVRPAGETASTSQPRPQNKRRPVANNKEKPTLVMRATVVACCDSMKWLVGLKSTVERIMLYQCEVMASSFIEWVSRRAREEYDGVAPTKPKPPAGPLPPISLPPPLRSLRNRQLSLPGEPSWDGGVHCGGAAGPIGGGAGGGKAVAATGGGDGSSANTSRRSSRAGGTRSAAASRPTSAGGDSVVFYDAMDSVPSSPLAVPTPETVAAAQLLGTQLSLSSSGAKHARDEAEAIVKEEAAKAAAAAAASAKASGSSNAPLKISASSASASRGPSKLGPKTRQQGGGAAASLTAAHVAKLQCAGASEAPSTSTAEHASKKGRRAPGAGVPSKGGVGSSGSKLVRSFKKMWTTSGEQQQQAAGSVEGQ